MIAQAFALAQPEAMRSLVLIGTAATFPEGDAASRATALRPHAAKAWPRSIPQTLERWFTPETRAQRPDIVDRV